MQQQSSTRAADRFLTEKEASDLTGMSVSWFRRCRWAGNGPAYIQTAKGGAVRYKQSVLLEWFDVRTISSTSQASTK